MDPMTEKEPPGHFTVRNQHFPVFSFGNLSHMCSWAGWEQGEAWLFWPDDALHYSEILFLTTDVLLTC